jgi:2-polyprenyl-6-methoxyphenol hydroxylase-like FAD-dependent oxidoreductase
LLSRHETDVVVVGAGIGGLAAGLALKNAGLSVRILERAGSPRELGFALLLAPNATHALRQLGVAGPVIEGGAVAVNGALCLPDGTVLRRFDLARVRDLLPDPTVMVLRPVLHGALLEAVGEDALTLRCDVTGFATAGDHVEVHAADGTRVRARVLVGADGAGSVVRRQLHPQEPPPRPSGLFGLRGVAHGVATLMDDLSGAQDFGRGVEAGLARAGTDTVYWYLSLPGSVVGPDSANLPAVIQRGLRGFGERFRAIVSATRPGDMRLDELVDREPLPRWGEGPVTLLGDAAHPMLPHAGQGAAQALEDAVALGRRLRPGGDVDAALRDYERVRSARTAAVVRLSRRNARVSALTSGPARLVRDVILKMTPERVILRSLVALGRPPEE